MKINNIDRNNPKKVQSTKKVFTSIVFCINEKKFYLLQLIEGRALLPQHICVRCAHVDGVVEQSPVAPRRFECCPAVLEHLISKI